MHSEAPLPTPAQPAGPSAAPGLEEKLDDATRARHPRHHRFRHRDVNHGQPGYAAGLTPYNLIWVFFTASVIGVVSETLLHLLQDGKWVRTAGMLYGPFNQVYGFGAVLLALLLYKFRDRNLLIVVGVGAVVGMAFEYVCSWLQQLAFGSTSWDYSHMASNIGGRTNLLYGIGWGLMGYFFISHFWPWMTEMVGRIPNKIGRPLSIVLIVVLMLDLSLSGAAVWREGQRHKGQPAINFVEQWLDDAYPDSVMAQKYPSMQFAGG